MSEPSHDREQLQAQVHTARLHFLAVELEVGHTMLDTAAGSQDADARARRRARAQEAHDEVERQLAKGEALGLTAAERDGLAAGLAQLEARLAAAPEQAG